MKSNSKATDSEGKKIKIFNSQYILVKWACGSLVLQLHLNSCVSKKPRLSSLVRIHLSEFPLSIFKGSLVKPQRMIDLPKQIVKKQYLCSMFGKTHDLLGKYEMEN